MIKIFCVTNKIVPTLDKTNLILAGVGQTKFPDNYLKCDGENNIFHKEKFYSELTFHYWYWKNMLANEDDMIPNPSITSSMNPLLNSAWYEEWIVVALVHALSNISISPVVANTAYIAIESCLSAWLKAEQLNTKMIMQVHDELVFEVADEACETLCNNVTERMANVIELQVPLLTEVGVGANWDEAH